LGTAVQIIHDLLWGGRQLFFIIPAAAVQNISLTGLSLDRAVYPGGTVIVSLAPVPRSLLYLPGRAKRPPAFSFLTEQAVGAALFKKLDDRV